MRNTIIITLLSILVSSSSFLVNFALNPESSKNIVAEDFVADASSWEWMNYDYTDDINWIKSAKKDIYIKSYDGLNLHAYLIESKKETDKWVITLHGYNGKADNIAANARNFFNEGYNLIVPDLRGHGTSEGDYIGMGWHDRKDILMWIDEILKINPDAKIALHGVSMGAATVMMTSGEESLPDNVKCVIEDCGYTSVWDEFEFLLQTLFRLPSYPILDYVNVINMSKNGYGLKQASALKQIKKSKTPTLFIHGDKDSFVPYDMLDILYEAAECEKEKLIIEGAAHGDAAFVNPTLYWDTVFKFIDKHM